MLYHSPVGSDHGDQILPLNLMRESFPDLHATHYAKYMGRESALGQTIPPLSCTWGDVAFLSPVDSGLLFDALRQSGRSVPSLPFCTLDCISARSGPNLDPADAQVLDRAGGRAGERGRLPHVHDRDVARGLPGHPCRS